MAAAEFVRVRRAANPRRWSGQESNAVSYLMDFSDNATGCSSRSTCKSGARFRRFMIWVTRAGVTYPSRAMSA